MISNIVKNKNSDSHVQDLLCDIYNVDLNDQVQETSQQVKLIAGNGGCVNVHAAILHRGSDFLREILSLHEPRDDACVILLKDFSLRSLQILVKLLYTGCADNLLSASAEEVTELCQKLQIQVSFTNVFSQSDEVSEIQESLRQTFSNSAEFSSDQNNLNVKLEENLSRTNKRNDCESDCENGDKSNVNGNNISTHPGQKTKNSSVPKQKRLLMVDLSPSDLTCKECGKEFKILYKLKLHSLIHSKSHPFQCEVCSRGFNNKYKMHAHQKALHRPLIRTVEESSPKSDKTSNGAKKTKVSSSRMCQLCNLVFGKQSELKNHINQCHPEVKSHFCPMCCKQFLSKKGLNHHKNYVCNPFKEKFECSICGSQLTCPKDLRRHLLEKHGQKGEWKCAICPTVCSSKTALDVHIKAKHKGPEEALPHRCNHCEKTFIKPSYLEDHIYRFHSAIKHFHCSQCDKSFATKKDLTRHKVIHEGRKPFQCSVCSKTFLHRINFKQHERIHLGERPYKCIPCNKGFNGIKILQKHHKSHQRKGDNTEIVKAAKGRKGTISYIDFSVKAPVQPQRNEFLRTRGDQNEMLVNSSQSLQELMPPPSQIREERYPANAVSHQQQHEQQRQQQQEQMIQAVSQSQSQDQQMLSHSQQQQHIMVPPQPMYHSQQSHQMLNVNVPNNRYQAPIMKSHPSPGSNSMQSRARPQAYIPSAQYIQNLNSTTPLRQMQVLGEYMEMQSYTMSPNALQTTENTYEQTQAYHSESVPHHSEGNMYINHDGYIQNNSTYQDNSHQDGNQAQLVHLSEADSIGMDIMGLFNETQNTNQGIENRITDM